MKKGNGDEPKIRFSFEPLLEAFDELAERQRLEKEAKKPTAANIFKKLLDLAHYFSLDPDPQVLLECADKILKSREQKR